MAESAEQQPKTQTTYHEQLFERSVHEGIQDTRELIDHAEIEAQAWKLIQNRDQLPQAETTKSEWDNNSRTALMEALMASGHLSKIEIRGTLEEIRSIVRTRLLNGWDDSLPQHELDRRFLEICEMLVTEKVEDLIIAGTLPPDTETGLISDFTGGGYTKEQAANLGYRDANKKGMVRSTRLIQHTDGTFSRVTEQIFRSNGLWSTTFAFLQNSGISIESGEPPDIIALKRTFIFNRQDYQHGIVDIQRILDKYAGYGIRYGDNVAEKPDHPLYEDLREESVRRETKLEKFISKLSDFEQRLNTLQLKGLITHEERVGQFKQEIDQILKAICTLSPEYATDCYGEKAAPFFVAANHAAAQGDWQRMQSFHVQAERVAEVRVICGMAISSKKSDEFGVSLSDTTELVKSAENGNSSQGIIRCIKCRENVPKKEVVKPKSWCCPRCKYEVDVCTGKIIHDGESMRTQSRTRLIDLITKPQPEQKAA